MIIVYDHGMFEFYTAIIVLTVAAITLDQEVRILRLDNNSSSPEATFFLGCTHLGQSSLCERHWQHSDLVCCAREPNGRLGNVYFSL